MSDENRGAGVSESDEGKVFVSPSMQRPRPRSRTTPGFLVGQAVAAIIGALHSSHTSGNWSLVEAKPREVDMTELVFAVGYVHEDEEDLRERVHIVVGRP